MAVTSFAAIDVGSNEISMKIFELTRNDSFRELTYVRHVMELGSDTYVNGFISNRMIDELCDILKGFTKIMKEYNVEAYTAYSTSSIREATNRNFLLDRVRVRTGIEIKTLSNAEERFLLFQAVALNYPDFNEVIGKGAIVVEIGSGSTQATCFSNGRMVCTQNLRLGSLRINEFLSSLERNTDSYEALLSEYIHRDINTSYKNYFGRFKTKTIVAIGEGLRSLENYIHFYYPDAMSLTANKMTSICNSLSAHSYSELSEIIKTSAEQAKLLLPTAMICDQMMKMNKANTIYFNTIDLCEGIVYEYAVNNGLLSHVRNFDKDIISAADEIARRFESNTDHTHYVEKIALKIFDSLVPLSGMNERDRLLLRVAIRLHDCGAYVNFKNVEANSYDIIMSSEIIGLTDVETHIIANVIRHKTNRFPAYAAMTDPVSEDDYIKIAKLTAIFRLANNLDRSKKQKLKNINVVYKKDSLRITGDAFEGLSLEYAALREISVFFEQTYGITPRLKQRRTSNV